MLPELSVSQRAEWSADRIREIYPNGAFLYYAPTGNATEIYRTLSRALPDTLVVVYDADKHPWVPFPQDGMVQLGSRMFVMSVAFHWYSVIMSQFKNLPKHEISSLVPSFFYTYNELGFDVIGGQTIRVGGSQDVWLTGLQDNKIAALQADCPLYCMTILKTMAIRMKQSNPSIIDDELYFVHEKGREYSHEDMLATVFVRPGGGYVWFVDEPLHTFAMNYGGMNTRELFATARSMPREYTKQGGLNIQYEWNTRNRRFIALVPTREALGPIAGELDKCGFDIVELGSEQFSLKSGVKCRSMHMDWRWG